MPSRGLRGLCLRGVASVAACLLALGSTGAMVTAAVVAHGGSGQTATLTSHDNGNGNGDGNGNGNNNGNGNGDGNGNSNGNSNGNGNGNGDGKGKGNGDGNGHSKGEGNGKGNDFAAILAQLKAEAAKAKAPKSSKKSETAPKAAPHSNPISQHSTTAHAGGQQTPAPTPKVIVDSSDPAPFSAQGASVNEAARVLPLESLGPLSGISFGSGLFIWPLLLAVDVFALAVIARMALRRRLVPPED